jgi:hypothetical protein
LREKGFAFSRESLFSLQNQHFWSFGPLLGQLSKWG